MDECLSQAQQAFNKIVQTRLTEIPSEPIVVVALAIWYEGFVPDITRLTGITEIKRAGYLLEKLMTFHCVTRAVRLAIIPTVDELIRRASSEVDLLPKLSILNVKEFSGDPLALRWRLPEDLNLQIQDILPYQTRTYARMRGKWISI